MKAERPLVVWFTNHHEHSLHYLKFGLMQMALSIRLKKGAYHDRSDEPLAFWAQTGKLQALQNSQ